MEEKKVIFAGFWIRVFALMIDTLVIFTPIILLSNFLLYSEFFNAGDFFIDIAAIFLSGIIIIWLWVKWSGGTPGKKILGIRVVDMETKGEVSLTQSIIRYASYLLSVVTLFIGFLIIGFRKDKRGLHDLISDTCVIYVESSKE